MKTVTQEQLTDFARKLLIAGGAEPAEAEIVADSLVGANLRGHDSHGVMRIAFYLDRLQQNVIRAGQSLTVVNESSGSLVVDGGWGFGQPLSQDLMNRLIAKARTSGIACGALRQSAHIGRLGEYAEMAGAAGMASWICANTHGAAQRVSPVGGKRPRIGTNPLCMGIPRPDGSTIVLDFGTSATAEGKVRVKKIAGQPVPSGWILDPEGKPTTDPNQLYGDPPGTILPMGGDQAYKGFGLAFMIELLCAGLSGSPAAYANPPAPLGNASVFVVFAAESFAGVEHMFEEAAKLEAYVRGVPLIDGVDHVTLPGDPERNILAERSTRGIPFDDGNWKALADLASTLGVEVPVAAEG